MKDKVQMHSIICPNCSWTAMNKNLISWPMKKKTTGFGDESN